MNSHTNREHVPTTPSQELLYDDELDKAADKLGSYELGRLALGMPTQESLQAPDAPPAPVDRPTAPRKQQRRRYVSGPQLGEDALPVPDQTRSDEAYDVLRQQVAPVLDQLETQTIARVRQAAVAQGDNPDAHERAYYDRRARDQRTRGK